MQRLKSLSKAEKIRQETGLSKRSLEEVIESLRVDFKHQLLLKNTTERILSSKNEEERKAGLAPYRRQILTEQKKSLAVMATIDLDGVGNQHEKVTDV